VNGTLITLFQPAEETGEGAQEMVDDGLFKRIPVPDVALAQHLLPGIAGTVRTRSGPFMSAADSLKVTVYRRDGHGASPQNTVDPVVLAAMIIVRLQTVVSRDVAPGDIAVVTVGSCQAGTRSNVIPDFAVLELNVRSYSSATRQRLLDAIHRRRGRSLHLLGPGVHRPGHLPGRREGRAPGRPDQQPLAEVPAPMQPCLRTGTETPVAAALVWLAP